jgi:putative inorganic carbon (HCO3(-)) transporter
MNMRRLRLTEILDLLIEAGWLIIIFLIPILFSYWKINYNLFQLPGAVIFSVLTELMLLAYILKVFLENRISFKISGKTLILLSALTASCFLSLYFSIHPLKSWQGSFIRQEGVYIFLHYILFFLLLAFNLKGWKQIKRIVITVLLSSVLVCAYGFFQYSGFDFMNWKKSAVYQGRIFSSLGQPNFLGHWLIMVIPLTFYSFFYVFKKNLSRFFVLLLLMAQILCLILTYSRAAWLGFVAEVFLFFLMFLIIFKKKILKLSLKNFLSAAILLIIIFVSLNVFCDSARANKTSKLIKRIVSIAEISGGSNRLRLFYWRSALDEIKQMPAKRLLFGYGKENISDVYVKYYRPEWGYYETINSYPDRSHNIVFDTVLQFGVFGLFIVLLFYCFVVWKTVKYIKYEQDNKKNWLAAVLLIVMGGYFINNLFSFSVAATYVYLHLFLAIAVFLIFENSKEKQINLDFLRNEFKILIYSAFVFVIAASIWLYNIRPAIADYYFMEVDKAKEIRGGHCIDILDNLNKTIRWAPDQSFYQNKYVYNSLNCLVGGNADEVNLKIKNNIDQIIEMAGSQELDYEFKVNIAHAYALFGFYFNPEYYKIADEKYQEMLNISPYLTCVYKDWGRMKLWQKDYDGAINLLEKGLSVIPDLSKSFAKEHTQEIKEELIIFYDNLADAYFYKKDIENALRYYKRVLELNPYYLKSYKKIANIYYRQGNIDKAIWHNKRGMMLNSKDYVWPYAIALLYQEKGDDKKALEYAEIALKLEPNNKIIAEFIKKINQHKQETWILTSNATANEVAFPMSGNNSVFNFLGDFI